MKKTLFFGYLSPLYNLAWLLPPTSVLCIARQRFPHNLLHRFPSEVCAEALGLSGLLSLLARCVFQRAWSWPLCTAGAPWMASGVTWMVSTALFFGLVLFSYR